jgi:uncharacterized protein (DUF2225 family)/CRP-like cAMP-binding protein
MIDLEKLRQLGTICKFEEGDFIFREGEPGEEMFVVLAGGVNIYIGSFDDTPINASTIGPGNFFGEMSLLENQPRSATVVAAEASTLMRINKANFLLMITQQPDLALNILTVLSSRVRFLNNEIKNRERAIRAIKLESAKHQAATSVESLKDWDEAAAVQHQQEQNATDLFPPQHKKYGVIAPATHKNFVLNKTVKCPVCHNDFTAKMVRTATLRTEKIEADFRKRYFDFEPLWYAIWVCTNCYYANHHMEFEVIPQSETSELRAKLEPLKNKIIFQFTDPREINQVFIAYYLALFAEKSNRNRPFKLGSLWLNLSWLYRDVHDQEMAKIASTLAFKYYHDTVNSHHLDISIEHEQQCLLIMGELLIEKGEEDEAIKCFQSACREGGKEAYNHQAQKRINGLKKL